MENVMQVIHKPTGEKRLINAERFNSTIHESYEEIVDIEGQKVAITDEEISKETENESVGDPVSKEMDIPKRRGRPSKIKADIVKE